jgi:hypothetical protein
MTAIRALAFVALWIIASTAGITGLVTGARAVAEYDPDCYLKCQREACKDACADDERCKACLESYDHVCREQCPVKKPPPVSR